MNNKDYGVLAKLLYETELTMEIIPSHGGEVDTYSFEYTLYLPSEQVSAVGGSLENYSGVHQLDYQDKVGIGWSLKEAWDDFCSKVDIMSIEIRGEFKA